ncbi:hypothetical protein CH333_04620, partial [candidate division WOR-3 bacterium JGI_Cruoil_03_44_89]
WFQSGSDGILEYCTIEYATYSTGYGIYANGAFPTIEHCTIQNNDYGFYGSNASPQIINCEIINNEQYGIYLTGACVPTFGSELSEWNDIYGNGSGNPDRDLRNGTEDIDAQYVYWGTIVQAEIENRIHHYPDDTTLGIVNYDLWTNAIHDTTYVGIFEEEVDNIPKAFFLSQNNPNPFAGETIIKYGLPRSSNVHIVIYNPLGQEVTTLVNRNQPAGYHTVTWDGRDDAGIKVSSDVYFLRFEAGDYSITRKLLMMR